MADPGTKKNNKVNHRPVAQKVMLYPFYLLLRLWNFSLRVSFEGDGLKQLQSKDQPYMIVTWHNTLFTSPMLIKRYRKGQPICGLVSASKDGAWLVAVFELIGVKTVRGSANFRGSQSLKELIRTTRAGYDIGITPDGSKGPPYVLKPGAAAVARACKVGIILLGVDCQNAWRLKSWDKFFVPKPFSKLTIRVERIREFSELGESDPYRASLILQEKLMKLQGVDPLIPDPAKEGGLTPV